jgi:hypothetical protein
VLSAAFGGAAAAQNCSVLDASGNNVSSAVLGGHKNLAGTARLCIQTTTAECKEPPDTEYSLWWQHTMACQVCSEQTLHPIL